VFQSELQAVNK